jgi:hypothetical protein
MGRRKSKLLLASASAVALIVLAVGCGGGSSSSSASRSGSPSEDPVGEASAEFLKPNSVGDKFVTFGSEAPPTEREAASKVLEENLKARAEANFATQCATLDISTIEEIVEPSMRASPAMAACPTGLKKLAEPLKASEKIRADTLDGPIAALRVKGDRAYALYHGNDKKNYSIPMEKEGGEWKVGALVTTELA